jgi:4-hydroxy-tetrahydrodipicolinate synthase
MAKAIHERLLPLFDGLFVVSNPIPVKYALNQVGFPVGGYRLPLTDPDEASAERIMAAVRACTVDLPLAARS